MFFIRRMDFSAFFVPYRWGHFGEESIRFGGFVVNLRQAEGVGKGKCLLINAGTTDDVHLFVGAAALQCGFERWEQFGSWAAGCGVGGEDNVSPVGQRAFGEGFECFASHNNGVSGSQRLETFQVVGQPEEELVFETDGVASVYGSDNRKVNHIILF